MAIFNSVVKLPKGIHEHDRFVCFCADVCYACASREIVEMGFDLDSLHRLFRLPWN